MLCKREIPFEEKENNISRVIRLGQPNSLYHKLYFTTEKKLVSTYYV
jgi:hypothetical protein